ncbi:MAG: hypothetical protein NZ765_12030 [Anaerolineae bacterium]|nr:hypothetical protein [Anaerolineae bacterium]
MAAEILRHWREGTRRVAIEPGTYSIVQPGEEAPLTFRDVAGLEIDARGVTLIFRDPPSGGFLFEGCRDVVLRGVTIRFEPLPFTQGQLVAIAADGSWYELVIDEGYLELDDSRYFSERPVSYVMDPRTRCWKEGMLDLSPTRVEKLGPRRFRLHWPRPSGPDVYPVTVGDRMAFRGKLRRHAISVRNCANMLFEDITIHSAPFAGIVEAGGEGGNVYRHISVRPGPPPAGAIEPPLFSTVADAFHSANVRRGPRVEECHFEAMPDDAVAIHGTYYLVAAADTRGLILARARDAFYPGDRLRLFDIFNVPVGEAVVVANEPLAEFALPAKTARSTIGDISGGPYVRVRTEPALSGKFDFMASNVSRLGSGYVVRNNVIRNHRARGMLLKAEDGLVEGNLVEGSTIGGIVLTPEFWWAEACYSRNVVVRNNTVRRVAYYSHDNGAIMLAAWDRDRSRAIPSRAHRNIVIENNTIEDINGVNLMITSAEGVVVRNNRFVRPHHRPPFNWPNRWGLNRRAVVWLSECDNVSLEGNQVVAPGPYTQVLLEATATVRGRGFESGIKQAVDN